MSPWPGRMACGWKQWPEVRMGSEELKNQQSNHEITLQRCTLSLFTEPIPLKYHIQECTDYFYIRLLTSFLDLEAS